MNVLSDEQAVRKPFELLLNQEKIASRVQKLGEEITRDYAGETPIIIGVLKGCVVFLADLIRVIKLPMELEFVLAASYRKGTKQDKEIILDNKVAISVTGRHVILVEGVVDSGRTVTSIMGELKKQNPASIAVATLIDKPVNHRKKLEIKYKGFVVGNEFVIGFGLDNTQRYRNLPFIGRMVDE